MQSFRMWWGSFSRAEKIAAVALVLQAFSLLS